MNVCISRSFLHLTSDIIFHNVVKAIILITCTGDPISSVPNGTGTTETTIGINTVGILVTVVCTDQTLIDICCHNI